MTLFAFIALTVGILVGLYCFRNQTRNWVYTLFHTHDFSTQPEFDYLYDMAKDRITYEWFNNPNIKSYRRYLRLLSDAQPFAFGSFQSIRRYTRLQLVWRIIPFLVIAILFIAYWYVYLIGMVLACIILFSYDFAKYGHRPGFYQRVVIYMILNGYINISAQKSDIN